MEIVNKSSNYYIPVIFFNIAMLLFIGAIIFFILVLFSYGSRDIILKVPTIKESKSGSIKLGKSLKGKRKKHDFYLSIKDLEKHIFICGATGTGKSNFLQNFLINFNQKYKIPFFLVEFKGEYHFLQKKIENVLILWPGENFSINIFDPEDSNPIIHAERIFDILSSCHFLDDTAEFTPQMQKVLVEVLTEVCQNKEFQNWEGFYKYCENYSKKFENKIPMLTQTLISIKNRIRRFSIGPLKALFENHEDINVKGLFKYNVILDLSSIIRLGGEKEDALFFLNLLLKYLWDENLTEGAKNYDGIKHITIVEDAQYFASQDLIRKGKLTSYLEDIALLLRGTGECLISLATRPSISPEILANCGVLVTFKNHIEKDLMCELLNLDIEKKNYLSMLEESNCLIRVNSIKDPFLLWVPYVKREYLNRNEINKNNQQIKKATKMVKNSINTDFYKPKLSNKSLNFNTYKIKNDHLELESYIESLIHSEQKKNNET